MIPELQGSRCKAAGLVELHGSDIPALRDNLDRGYTLLTKPVKGGVYQGLSDALALVGRINPHEPDLPLGQGGPVTGDVAGGVMAFVRHPHGPGRIVHASFEPRLIEGSAPFEGEVPINIEP